MDIGPQVALTVIMGTLLLGVAFWVSRLENWRLASSVTSGGATGEEYAREKPSGVIRWAVLT